MPEPEADQATWEWTDELLKQVIIAGVGVLGVVLAVWLQMKMLEDNATGGPFERLRWQWAEHQRRRAAEAEFARDLARMHFEAWWVVQSADA